MKCYLLFLFSVLLFSCNQPLKKADFHGKFVNKELIRSKGNLVETMLEKDIYLPMMAFDSNFRDSVKFYFRPDSVKTLWAFYAYDSYNLKLNEDKETMIAWDYTQNEIFFLDRKRNKFQRFVKLDNLANGEIKRTIQAYFGKSN
jgi:hypothetical protein